MQRFWPAALVLGAALAAWLWPLGVGLRMPVGGDVTRFQVGLMAFLQDSWAAGRLPIWDDRWGFGFPGIAESQMGVFYPPHWLLYGPMPLEWAYTASLAFHTLVAGFGAMWAARAFGASAWGAALAGWSFAASGFFLIHLPHQWGYSTGCWAPWAWGLAWRLAQGGGGRRTVAALAGVLAVQMLYGHFQIAFITQACILLMGGVALASRRPGRGGAIAAAWGLALGLAAVQLWPTFGLARLASADRDPNYLSDFAATPLHLVNFVAPDLFHHSPLWRPVAWDPLHTSPEENRPYLGLVPLFLALAGFSRGWRTDSAARALGLIALATLLLSLGPYMPGFRWWCRLPGFSFFRAPGRWNVATTLALSLLAARGWDALAGWMKGGRALRRFALASAIWIGLVLLAFEGAAVADPKGSLAGAYDQALRRLPFDDQLRFLGWKQAAMRPQAADPRVEQALVRRGAPIRGPEDVRWMDKRWSIYADELWRTAALLTALGGVSLLASRPSWFRGGLFGLALIDLWALGLDKPVDHGPIRPLVEQSPVLARLASDPGAPSRVVTAGAGNLPMVAGFAPIPDYRTLDLPAAESLSRFAQQAPDGRIPLAQIEAAQRAIGARYRLVNPDERANWRAAAGVSGVTPPEPIEDPALAGWLFGTAWAESRDAEGRTFLLRRVPGEAEAVAWAVPAAEGRRLADLEETSDRSIGAVLGVMADARPLPLQSAVPEEVALEVEAEGPTVVVLTRTYTPRWSGIWEGPGGPRSAEIRSVLGGWQGVEVPGPGTWRLALRYDGSDLGVGAGVTAGAGVAWLILMVPGLGRRRER